MGKSFRKERSDWDDADWGYNARNQRDSRKAARDERNARKTRRNFDDRQAASNDED